MAGQEHYELDEARALCQQFERDLPAYLEGEERPALLEHIQRCPYCAALLSDLQQIRFVSRDLTAEDPPARVWANIRASLREEGIIREQRPVWQRWLPRPVFFPRPSAVGALAFLALLAATLLVSPQNFREAPAAAPGGESVVAAGVIGPVLNEDMARTLREMEEAYLAREGSFEPAMKAAYRKSLDSLDASIRECARHCQRAPGDALARQYLVHAYESKAEVLASALELSGP